MVSAAFFAVLTLTIVFVVSLYLPAISRSKPPTLFGFQILIVYSDNAEQFASRGDFVLLNSYDEYSIGEFIAIKTSFGYTVGEVKKETVDGGYVIEFSNKNGEIFFRTVTHDSILGKCERRIANLGGLIFTIRQYNLVFLLGSALVFFSIIFSLFKTKDNFLEFNN